MKWLGIVDEYTREHLALEVDRGIPAQRVSDVPVDLFLTHGVPEFSRSNNGPESIAPSI